MSAPIDDLLYGGDDSGDDDDLNSVPLSSFSAPLPTTSPLPMAVPPNAAPLGAPSAVLSAPLSAPLAMNPASVSAPVSSMAPSATSAALPMGAQRPLMGGPAGVSAPAVAASAPVKQAGHQMFQQMFALLKQMLPPEQYAALHSEMRNGNGNDIKSIVDIIKRIAGDAIFASVIQKMDLTRNHSAAAGSLGIVKPEPNVAGLSAAAPTSAAAPVAMTRPLATPPPSLATSTPLTQTTAMPLSQPITASPPATMVPPSAPAAIQRPNITASTPPPPVTAPISSSIKAEPLAVPMAAMTPPLTATATPAPVTPTSVAQSAAASSTTTAAASAGANGGKADTQEKIEFAKKLLFHASTCTLPPGICTVKRCDDVRRVFKHSVSCGGARGCSHCKQLKALVEYHAKECLVPVGEHCKIPFCDAIRRNNATARARAATTGIVPPLATATTASTPSTGVTGATGSAAPSAIATSAPTSSVLSDDDEDNTPLASAVTKVKKTKAKSPKTTPAATPSSTAASKKKTTTNASSKPSTPAVASNVSTPSSTGSSTPANAATTAATTNKAKPVSAALAQAQEYGRLLQLILHVETCKTSTCPVGEDCVESKALLRQINSPDAPARAQTYKKVYAHYKVCVAKKTTHTCPMCKIGLMPLDVTGGSASSTTTSSSTTTTAASSSTTTNASTMSPAVTAAVPATSPSVASLKRSNSSLASPRSPSKKPRVTAKSGKASAESSTAASTASAAIEQPSSDLVSTSRTDLRKEEDVLTHTQIDLNAERRIMMDGSRRKQMPERLPCQKEAWIQNDLFTNEKLTRHMERIAKKHGVTLGSSPVMTARTTQVMAHALQEYLKQVMEEMVEAARLRGDASAHALDQLVKKEMGAGLGGAAMPRELTSTDILRVSCDDSFARLRQEDLALRARLLEDAKREELAEKERAKKRKKVDRVKLQAQEEKDEAEMDVEELAVKDLKERLLQEDKDGVVHVDGRVNESLTAKYVRRVDDQVTMEDATYWLENQKPFLHPKLFVRAEAARIVTKSLL